MRAVARNNVMAHSYRCRGCQTNRGECRSWPVTSLACVVAMPRVLDRRRLQQEFDIDRDPRRAPRAGLQRGSDGGGAGGAGADRSKRPTTPWSGGSRPLTWGLVPSWAKDRRARCADDQRPGRDGGGEARVPHGVRRPPLPAAGRRLLRVVRPGRPRATDAHGGKGNKQPFFIHRRDGGLLVMAGAVRDLARPGQGPRRRLGVAATCTVITTEATDAGGPHPRPDADGGAPRRPGTPGSTRP